MTVRDPRVRITIGLVSLTITVVLIAEIVAGHGFGAARREHMDRLALAESLAVQYSSHGPRTGVDVMRAGLRSLKERNASVLSAALRTVDGAIVARAGDHNRHWQAVTGESTPTHIQVPVYHGTRQWGALEIAFAPLEAGGGARSWTGPFTRFLLIVAALGGLAYLIYIRRTLRHLDPSAVVPERVKAALNVLAEGVLLLDRDGRIVLANEAFSKAVKRPMAALTGQQASALDWLRPEGGPPSAPSEYPWLRSAQQGVAQRNVILELEPEEGAERRKFVVSCVPITDGRNRIRGTVATFDDVTDIERTNHDLRQLTAELARSQDELRTLASRDPLTGAYNRRALFESVDLAWQDRDMVGCIMLDIDRFKSFNDRYGHTVGDEIIQSVARVVGDALRTKDVLGRYGGEEFCVLLPGVDVETAHDVAVRLRADVERLAGAKVRGAAGLTVTASFGVAACRAAETTTPAELIDQADQALVRAKRTGRNRVGVWDPAAGDLASDVAVAAAADADARR